MPQSLECSGLTEPSIQGRLSDERGSKLLLEGFQKDISQLFTQPERSVGSEVVLGVREMRGLDDRDVAITASHLMQCGVDRFDVAPRSVFVLLGDEPRQIGLLVIDAQLVDQLLQPLGVVLGIRPEVGVVLARVKAFSTGRWMTGK